MMRSLKQTRPGQPCGSTSVSYTQPTPPTNDYIEIARSFQAVVLSDVPVMDQMREDQARRFIALVDEFYDRRVKLIISAAASIDVLYAGTRLTREFERTRSRLLEMQSQAYLAAPHVQ